MRITLPSHLLPYGLMAAVYLIVWQQCARCYRLRNYRGISHSTQHLLGLLMYAVMAWELHCVFGDAIPHGKWLKPCVRTIMPAAFMYIGWHLSMNTHHTTQQQQQQQDVRHE